MFRAVPHRTDYTEEVSPMPQNAQPHAAKTPFRDDAGHFSGIIETRPYMRALHGLAQSFWKSGAREEAVKHYKHMLCLAQTSVAALLMRVIKTSAPAVREDYRYFFDQDLVSGGK
jgi:hypothetical protein